MKNSTRLATIDFLLKDVPAFTCKDGCADCCGPVVMTRLEMRRIVERTGKTEKELDFVTVLESQDQVCPLLDRVTRKCTVYDIRPAICKVFGASDARHLSCPHGCSPVERLSAFDTEEIIQEVEQLGHGFPAHSHALPQML